MSVVKINAMQIPEGKGEEFLARFSKRPHKIEQVDGFEGFKVLRPNDERGTWIVVTEWRDDDADNAWYGERALRATRSRSPMPLAGSCGRSTSSRTRSPPGSRLSAASPRVALA